MQTTFNQAEARELTEKAKHMCIEERRAYLMGFDEDDIYAELARRHSIDKKKELLYAQLNELEKERKGESE